MYSSIKRNENDFRTSSSTIDCDSEKRQLRTKIFFPRLFSDCNLENFARNSVDILNTSDEECFEKLKNIRSNISHLRQKVSTASKIYDNLSCQIENGMNNLPKDEVLLIDNKKLKEDNIFYKNENQKLKKRISELEKESKVMISKYKDKYLKEIKQLELIFQETINEKNNEIENLKHNEDLLKKKVEEIKETYTKEIEELKKHNEETLNNNLELQKQIGNLYYNKWNNKISHLKKNFIYHSYRNKGSRRKSTENLETVIEEDKTDILLSKNDMKKSYSSLDIKKDDNDVNGKMKKDY